MESKSIKVLQSASEAHNSRGAMSINSAVSEISLGFVEQVKSTTSPGNESGKPVLALPLKPMATPKVTTISNVCCLVFYCPLHKRIAIRKYAKKGYFLPHVSFRPSDSWHKVINYAINSLRSRMPKLDAVEVQPEVFDVMRVQLAKTRLFYTRLTILVRLVNTAADRVQNLGQSIDSEPCVSYESNEKDTISHESKAKSNAKDAHCWCYFSLPGGNHVLWMDKEQLNTTLCNKFSGAEALLFYCLLEAESAGNDVKKSLTSLSLLDALHFFKKRNSSSLERKLLTDARYSPKAVLFLFNEFVLHCFPSRHMTFLSFKNFLRQRLNWNSEEAVMLMLFRALNIRESNFLSFNELVQGLAAMDAETPHKDVLETRLKYIFRFYDSDLDNRLNMSEICQLINDIVLKNKDTELMRLSKPEEIASRLNDHFIQSKLDKSIGIELSQFITISMKSRTFYELAANIFRAPFSILGYILVHFNFQEDRDELAFSAPQSIARHTIYGKTCRACKQIKYNIAGQALCFVSKREEMQLPSLEMLNSAMPNQAKDGKNKDKDKEPARDHFGGQLLPPGENMVALDLLIRLRQLAQHRFQLTMPSATKKGKEETAAQWYFATKAQQLEALKQLLDLAKSILQGEDKLASLKSPTYIVGHLHGNLRECFAFSSVLWKYYPFLTPVGTVILGNFIDGPGGLEVAIFLLCLKILAPKRVIILRGLQEIRATQKKMASVFMEQCHQLEPSLWETINAVFDKLPLGCVIDDQLFCSSSGYPLERVDIAFLKFMSPSAMAKPLEVEAIKQILCVENVALDNDGGVAFRRFLTSNQQTHMLRCHTTEPWLSEEYADNDYLISLYSGAKVSDEARASAKYNIYTAFALVARNTIRIVRLDSSGGNNNADNQSADNPKDHKVSSQAKRPLKQ